MFCTKCGSQVSDDAAVCPNCGEVLNAGNPAQNYAGAQPQATYSAVNTAPANQSFFAQQADKLNPIGLFAVVVGIVCTFFASVQAKASFLGMTEEIAEKIINHYGYLILVLFVVTGVMMLLRKDHVALIPAVANVIFCLFKVFQELGDNSEELEEYISYGMEVSVSLNAFFWIMVVAAVVSVVAVFINRPAKNNQPTM